MFKKILSLVLLPLVALSCFVGCGKAKSVDDIKGYWEQIKNKHIVEEAGSYKSNIFPAADETGLKNFNNNVVVQYSGQLDELNAGKPYVNITVGNMGSTLLYYRYRAVKELQQRTLDGIFNYYQKWSENFYAGMKLVPEKKLDKDDLTDFYKEMEKFDEQLSDFASARNKFEQDVNVLGLQNINRAVITTYSLAFNDLIDASYSFVNKFKDLHVKYIWSSEETSAGSLERLADESTLHLSYLQYVELSAFNDSECDLSGYAESKLANPNITQNYLVNLGKEYNAENSVDVDELKYTVNVFNQKFDKVKNVLGDINLYKLYRIMFDYDKSTTKEDYINSLSQIDKANLQVYTNFMSETVGTYINAVSKLFK